MYIVSGFILQILLVCGHVLIFRPRLQFENYSFIEHDALYYQYCGHLFLFFGKPYQYMLIGSFTMNYMSFGQYLK
jgi:hypothetical protein